MSEEAPLLVGASTRQLVVAPIRLVLAALGIAAAAIAGPGLGRVLAEAVFGAVLFTVFLVVTETGKQRRSAVPEALPAPPDSRYSSLRETAVIAIFPSTVGVTALAVIALFLDVRLAGFLAGVLGGMGLAGLATGTRLRWSEHRDGARLFVSRARRPRLYVGR